MFISNVSDAAMDIMLEYTCDGEYQDIAGKEWTTEEVQELLEAVILSGRKRENEIKNKSKIMT